MKLLLNRFFSKYRSDEHFKRIYRRRVRKYEKVDIPVISGLDNLFVLLYIMLRTAAMVTGRVINRNWQKLSDSEKGVVMNNMKNYSKLSVGSLLVAAGFSAVIFHRNLEYNEITGRKRFMAIGRDEYDHIVELITIKNIFFSKNALSTEDPLYKFVKKILDTIISKNKEHYAYLNQEWELMIVEEDKTSNALCGPNNLIVVYTGLLNFLENPHQLAAVLAHELSHAILEHGREKMGWILVTQPILLICSFLLWTFIPGDLEALFSTWIKNRIVNMALIKPHSRVLEEEADILGLELMARACFKVKETQRMLEIMGIENWMNPPSWLSSHPNVHNRIQTLQRHLYRAQKISKYSGCFKDCDPKSRDTTF